jgi:hypothetical protein
VTIDTVVHREELPAEQMATLAQSGNNLMRVTWRVSQSASCFHAAVVANQGHALTDSQLAEAIRGPCERLCDEIKLARLSPDEVFPEMYALAAAGIESDRLLVERALSRRSGTTRSSEPFIQRLTGRVRDLEVAYRNLHASRQGPPLVEELEIRSGPLREQWQAYGPGLLHQIGQMTEPDLIAESAEIVLVQPAVGGHGVAHLGNNRVTFEAVLTNPVPELPEVVRLAWLLAQLQLDLPRFGERIARDRLPVVAMHALLPPTLAAVREMEIALLGDDSIRKALDAWHVGDSGSRESRAQALGDWWQAYESNPPAWPVAIAALDTLLPAGIDVDAPPSDADDPA